MAKDQADELAAALAQQRQPRCVACGDPLDVVLQNRCGWLEWVWDEASGRYVREDNIEAEERPHHRACGHGTWDLVDADRATEQLGLTS